MHLVYDARHLCLPYSGLGRYAASLLYALMELPDKDRPAQCTVLVTEDFDAQEAYADLKSKVTNTSGFRFLTVDVSPFRSIFSRRLATAVNSQRADHYFYPHYDLPIGINTPATFVVHDLMPLLLKGYLQKWVSAKRTYFYLRTLYSLLRSEACVAVSGATRRDILTVFGQRFAGKVLVIHSGVKRPPSVHLQRPVQGEYLLYVGDRRPHKNLLRLLQVYQKLVTDQRFVGRLVIIGPSANYGFDLEQYCRQTALPVDIVGPVSEHDLNAYYKHAKAHILISSYEGFGLPVLEAARYGTKTIVSDLGALPEVAPAGTLVLPHGESIPNTARRIMQYLDSKDAPDGDVVMSEHSWTRTALSVLRTIKTPNDPVR